MESVKKLVEGGGLECGLVLTGQLPSGETVVQKRLDWIEMAKGIGVTFVVLVHSIIPRIDPVTTHLSSFTIPIFFVLTGLTYNNEKHRTHLRNLATSRARQLLIPYLSLYVIMMILFIPLSPSIETYLTPDQLVFWFLYGSGPPDSATHLWFLPVLFLGMMVFVTIDRITYSLPRAFRWITLMLLVLAADIIWSLFRPVLVPWRISSVLLAASFMIIGNEMRRLRGLKRWTYGSRVRNTIGALLATTTLLTLSQLNGFTDMAVDRFGVSLWLYIPAGVLGSVLVFQVSSLLDRFTAPKRAFLALGGASQEVYEVHPVTFLLVPIAVSVFGITLANDTDLSHSLWPARFILGIGLSLVLVNCLIRRNRFLSLVFSGTPLHRVSNNSGG
jgi:fucose 4-O-acetylase-like acetyltransferase